MQGTVVWKPVSGEGRVVVIEHCPGPRCRRVARGAGGREASRRMSGVVRTVVVGGVARITIGRYRGVVVVGVAARTRHCRMEASEREGPRGVIEARGIPSGRCMADRAVRWEP